MAYLDARYWTDNVDRWQMHWMWTDDECWISEPNFAILDVQYPIIQYCGDIRYQIAIDPYQI